MSDKKKPWADEPTPLCDEMDEVKTISEPHVHAAELLLKARDLERKLRICQRHLKPLAELAALRRPTDISPVFIGEVQINEIKTLVERMEQDGEVPLGR